MKLDRSFLVDIADDARSALVIHSTVELAHDLGLRVVAEGVEDAGALEAVTSLGCDRAQGFLFGVPAPGDLMLLDLDRHTETAVSAM